MNAVEDANINMAYYRKLTQGFDVKNEDGVTIKNESVTKPGLKPKSYAFCSDTMYKEDIIPIIKNADVLYHESTFLKNHLDLAAKTKHSTAGQAAQIAAKAQVGGLILGHYSTRYGDLNAFVAEAQESFQNVYLAEDNKVFEI
mgnify:CR=1 FL=1